MLDRIEWVNDWPQIANTTPSDTAQRKPKTE
jgi:hypothetical protein